MNDIIYLDNNATTKLDPRVLEAMMPYLTEEYANAASNHEFGISINNAVKESRKKVAELIGAETNEIIFTSGATEAINLAIKGVAENYTEKGKHIITVQTEHSAVLDVCRYLETKGFEITFLQVESDGLLNLNELEKFLRKDTILVCIMFVNNEIGVIQPIKEIAEITHKNNTIFMSDATQAVGKIPVNINEFGIDLMSLSGHKFYGPKGIGGLYIKNNIKIEPIFHGGGQENNLRSGTLNVPGVIGLSKALQLSIEDMVENEKLIRNFRDEFENRLLLSKCIKINGHNKSRLFNVSNVCFFNTDPFLIIKSLKNIAYSQGLACNSSLIKPSHVLKAIGISDREALSSFRFSFGKYNNLAEVFNVLNKLIKVCQQN